MSYLTADNVLELPLISTAVGQTEAYQDCRRIQRHRHGAFSGEASSPPGGSDGGKEREGAVRGRCTQRSRLTLPHLDKPLVVLPGLVLVVDEVLRWDHWLADRLGDRLGGSGRMGGGCMVGIK